MQPYLFPYIGYWQLINAVDKFVIFDDVNFIVRGWINRNRILQNDKPFLFSLPLIGASQNKKINDLEIFEFCSWKNKFLKTIKSYYSKAPFFSETYDFLSNLLSNEIKNLSCFLLHTIKSICSALSITTNIIDSSTFYKNSELIGQNRILDICVIESATHYLNLPGGETLYTKESFENLNISLMFIKPQQFSYDQFSNNFIPSLSIIDLLMFLGFKNTKDFLFKYDLF